MAYSDIFDLRYNTPTLRKKIVVAIADASMDVLNEDPGTSNHTNRVKWANVSLADTEIMADRMYFGVLENATIQSVGDAATDGDVQFVINGLINVYSNIYA